MDRDLFTLISWPLNPRNSQGCLLSPISKGLAGFAVAAVLSTAAAVQGLVTQKKIGFGDFEHLAASPLPRAGVQRDIGEGS